MGRKKDILDKLAERLARGEISEKTYLEIKERYDKEGFPDEEPEPRESEFGVDIERTVREVVRAATTAAAGAAQVAQHAAHAIGDLPIPDEGSEGTIHVRDGNVETGCSTPVV